MKAKHEQKPRPNAFIIQCDTSIIANEQLAQPSLELLQETVGGPITILHVPLIHATAAGMLAHVSIQPNMAQLIVNEEGQMKSNTPLPLNPVASSIAATSIVGVAVLLIGKAKVT